MDIICAKCGIHFSSVETAREHRGNCRETSQGEQIHWVPAEKSKITPAEWGSLVNLINTQNPSPSETSPNVHPTTIQSENAKEPTHNRPTYSSRQCSGSQSNSEQSNSVKNPSRKRSNFRITTWLIALLFVFAFSLCGLGVSLFVGSFTPLWMSLGFSVVFSIERWFRKTTARKAIGRVYRLLLNLGILSALSLLVWSGIQLFSGQTASKPIVDSMLLLAEFVLFVWLWKVVARNSWRWPSMKLTIFSLLCVAVVFAFAGVAPFSSYKDTLIAKWEDFQTERAIEQAKREVEAERKAEEKQIAKSLAETPIQPATSAPTPSVIRPPVSTTSPTAPAVIIIPGPTSNVDRSTFQEIDQYALGTPESVAKSIDSLAAYLVQPAKNDFEKTRAIYRWITQNISYDFSAYLTKSYGSTKATDVLVGRSSVCQGYSTLFNALATSAGLEVVTISGWAKGYSYNAGDQITGPTNHAWNAVKINDGWYLIDSTWGAGSIIQQRFVREFNEAYFLTLPEQFIYNHLPTDPKWQLLSTPFSKNDFSSLPYVHSKFFSYGLKLGNNTQSVINAKGSLSMTFPVPSDTYLMARVKQGNIELAETLTSARRSGNQYQINATFPNPGTYVLSIFARKNGAFGMYDSVLEYKVLVGSTP